MVERFGADDLKAPGAKAYFFNGGTTTPLVVFQDAAEGSAHTHPLLADANGRWPDVFVPYITSYDVRVTTAENVTLTFTQLIPNPDPIDLTVTIPAENQVATGMIHAEFVNATKAGYVRLNGRTLGNAASGATERANADTSALFTYLWSNVSDTLAPVSAGRGVSAAADYAANKTITLPDMRGYTFTGLDDMGNVVASAYSGLTFGAGNATTTASTVGGNSAVLATANMPSHTHTGTTSSDGAHTPTTSSVSAAGAHTHIDSGHTHTITDPGHFHDITPDAAQIFSTFQAGANNFAATTGPTITDSATTGITINSGTANIPAAVDHTHTVTLNAIAAHNHTFTTSSQGSGTSFANLGLSRLITWFIKL